MGRLKHLLFEVKLGGTAIVTRGNTPDGYAEAVVAALSHVTGLSLELAGDMIEASSNTGAYVTFSSVPKPIAVKLSKICNDLRLLSSGLRLGFNEIRLAPVQTGSSIMADMVTRRSPGPPSGLRGLRFATQRLRSGRANGGNYTNRSDTAMLTTVMDAPPSK